MITTERSIGYIKLLTYVITQGMIHADNDKSNLTYSFCFCPIWLENKFCSFFDIFFSSTIFPKDIESKRMKETICEQEKFCLDHNLHSDFLDTTQI